MDFMLEDRPLADRSSFDPACFDNSFIACPLAPDEIIVVARHEHLTLLEAAQRATALMREPWGHAALRQMVWDEFKEAQRRGNSALAEELCALFHRTCQRYPSLYDRRHAPTRETHPFPPGPAV